jgi:uncharacterized protein (TIGR03437 family)
MTRFPTRFPVGLVALLLLGSLTAAAQTRLSPGQLATRTLPVLAEAVLYNGAEGFYVDVPANATRVVLELNSSPPEAAIDLFTRVGEDVQLTAADTVVADYRSESAGGSERIEITPSTSPPLQMGRYFVAVRAMPDNVGAFYFLRVSIDTLVAGDTIQIVGSDFTGGEDYWQRNYPAATPEVPASTVGDPRSSFRTVRDSATAHGRYLEIQSKGSDYFVAGKQFLGNLGLLGTDPRVEFDLRYRPPKSFATQDIEMKIFGRFTVYRWVTSHPDTDFQHYSVPLHASVWQLVSGSDSFEKVLSNVLRIEIRANYGQEDGLTDLDNFTLYGRAQPPLVPVLTTFDTSLEGWALNFPDAPFLIPRAFGVTIGDQRTVTRVIRTDGVSGGYLQIDDDDNDVNQDFMVAPPAYLGDLSQLGNEAAFEFYRRHQSTLGATRPVEIRLIGFGAAYRYLGPLPGHEWTPEPYRVPLTADSWTLIEGDRSFEDTLRAVQRIEVSVDDLLGNELNGLDNFRLVGSPSEVPVLSASPDSFAFTAVVGEEDPAPELTEISSSGSTTEWTAHVAGGSNWLVLDLSQGTTPGGLVLRIDAAGLSPGTYNETVEVVWAGAPEPLTIGVRLTVIEPTTPRLSMGGVVNNATFVPNSQPGGELSGGMFVALFGERLATDIELATSVPFPGSLAGTSATMGGLLMPLVYVSPKQIVGVVPQALTQVSGVAQNGPSNTADVVVRLNGDSSPIETVRLKPVQPLIFTQNESGTGLGAIQNVLDGGGVQLNTFDTPARPGQTITIFATGLGPTQTPVPDGFAATGVNRVTGQARVSIGGVADLEPSFAGLSPNSPHLYQVNATVPDDSQTGCAVPLRLSIDGVASNEVTLAVTADGAPCR